MYSRIKGLTICILPDFIVNSRVFRFQGLDVFFKLSFSLYFDLVDKGKSCTLETSSFKPSPTINFGLISTLCHVCECCIVIEGERIRISYRRRSDQDVQFLFRVTIGVSRRVRRGVCLCYHSALSEWSV